MFSQGTNTDNTGMTAIPDVVIHTVEGWINSDCSLFGSANDYDQTQLEGSVHLQNASHLPLGISSHYQ